MAGRLVRTVGNDLRLSGLRQTGRQPDFFPHACRCSLFYFNTFVDQYE